MSGMNYALLKHEICGILGTRHVGYPQVGTSHVLKISAILKSLYSVSSLPFESGAFVDLMIFFSPLRISCKRSWACLPLGSHKYYQSVAVGLSHILWRVDF